MECKIQNCNNIEDGKIQIVKNKLNIKYGINGTGKSTISRAIKFKAESPDRLKELTPFKNRAETNIISPNVDFSEDISSVLIFNEEYLDQFLFKEDELISNSYEIFIKTPEYTQSVNEIDQLLLGIKRVFSENSELDTIISDFETLSSSFKTTSSNLSKSSAVFKALKNGNKIEHIPKDLIGYSNLIKGDNCVSWLDWHSKGESFFENSGNCPYCSSTAEEKKEAIKSISQVYDRTVVKNFNRIIDALSNLGEYLSDDANNALIRITKKSNGLDESEMNYIIGVKAQIDNLLTKLKALKNISSISFEESETIEEKLNDLKISMDVFDRFNSAKTTDIISALNASLDSVLSRIGQLKGKIAIQNRLVRRLIDKYKLQIDNFLINAGYKYTVEITNPQSADYKLILKHVDSTEYISKGDMFLSYGEKNAFALVLFMYESLSKKPDLIILDDPISSFDKNKKYAIMHMLFRGDSSECLKNKTVLMLTHDLDPVIDTVKVLKEFRNLSESNFITVRNGQLAEINIEKNDILSFSQICTNVISSNVNTIIKLIYLRRYFEVIDDKSDSYEVLSNLFHKRSRQNCSDHRKEIGNDSLSEEDFNNGESIIKGMIADFDYETALTNINNIEYLKVLFSDASNSYIKMSIFRLLHNVDDVPSVLRKFINETYHIENEQIYQLDHLKFDMIPSYIIEECDNYLKTINPNN